MPRKNTQGDALTADDLRAASDAMRGAIARGRDRGGALRELAAKCDRLAAAADGDADRAAELAAFRPEDTLSMRPLSPEDWPERPAMPPNAHPYLHLVAREIDDVEQAIARLSARRRELVAGLAAKIAEWSNRPRGGGDLA